MFWELLLIVPCRKRMDGLFSPTLFSPRFFTPLSMFILRLHHQFREQFTNYVFSVWKHCYNHCLSSIAITTAPTKRGCPRPRDLDQWQDSTSTYRRSRRRSSVNGGLMNDSYWFLIIYILVYKCYIYIYVHVDIDSKQQSAYLDV